MEREFAFSDGCSIEYADDVLLGFTLETCMALLTNVTPIISILKKEEEISISRKIKWLIKVLQKYIWVAKWILIRKNPNKSIQRKIINFVKLKQKNLKSSQEKWFIIYKGTTDRMTTDFYVTP